MKRSGTRSASWIPLAGVLAVALGLAATPAPVRAWGAKGHRTVAQIAENHPSEKARHGVRQITGAKGEVDHAHQRNQAPGQHRPRHAANEVDELHQEAISSSGHP